MKRGGGRVSNSFCSPEEIDWKSVQVIITGGTPLGAASKKKLSTHRNATPAFCNPMNLGETVNSNNGNMFSLEGLER